MPNDTVTRPAEKIAPQIKFEYVLKLFLYHADQRIKSFNFYILLLIATIGGTITIFEKLSCTSAILSVGIFNVVIAAIFYVVDVRSKRLVEISRNALVQFESLAEWVNYPSPMRDEGAKQVGVRRFVSLTFAFRLTFVIHALFGVILCLICIH